MVSLRDIEGRFERAGGLDATPPRTANATRRQREREPGYAQRLDRMTTRVARHLAERDGWVTRTQMRAWVNGSERLLLWDAVDDLVEAGWAELDAGRQRRYRKMP